MLHLVGARRVEEPRGGLDVVGRVAGEHPLGVVVEEVGGLEDLLLHLEIREQQHGGDTRVLQLGHEDGCLLLVLRRRGAHVRGHRVVDGLGDLEALLLRGVLEVGPVDTRRGVQRAEHALLRGEVP